MTNLKRAKIEIAMKKINGTSMLSVNNYTNLQDEISNQTVLVGFNYEKRLLKDLTSMKKYSTKKAIVKLYNSENKELVKSTYNKLLKSLIKRTSSDEVKAELLKNGDSTIVKSQAQKEAYETIAKGLNEKK